MHAACDELSVLLHGLRYRVSRNEKVIATFISIEVRALGSDDRYMGKRLKKQIMSVLTVLTSILMLVILLGQGCGSPIANGNGNGGGYGGYKPDSGVPSTPTRKFLAVF